MVQTMVKKTTILFTLLVLAYTGFAQTYPVNVSTTLTPPYSVYLADYVAPGSDRLAINVFLGDVNRPELQVKLRLRIEGQGIIIETKAGYLPPPLILQGGIPQRLIATDLADYLAPQNLNFQGITRQQFERTGALPEGLYRFCFEVLEYNRGVKISNTGCTMAWMILNDPPLINLPRQNEKIRPQDPQFITFQWTPRHTGSPNSAFSTEYEFSMVELWPATRNPNDAIFTMPPIHQVTTQSTMLIYGPAETPLVAGRSYAFRIKAKSIVGVDELDLFKNNGYSEVFTFTYGDACTLPKNISAEAVNAGKFKVTWQANYNHSGFSVRYKLADNPTAEWYEEDTFFEEIEIDGLQPETTYEYQVSSSCGAFTSEFSAIAKVTTPALPEVNFTCGLPPENFQLDNTTPVEGLKVGDVIKAGDFDVKVVELTPNGNRYTGKGNVVVPYLDNLLVSVDFLNIEVNTDYRLFAGEMDIIGIGLDIIPPELSELLDKLDEGLATLDDLLGDISEGLDLADEILDAVGGLANDIMDNGPFTPDEEAELDGISVEEYNQKAKEALADAIGAIANAKATDDYEVVARKVAQALTLKKRGNKLKNIYNTADTLNVIAVAFYENTMYGFDAQQYPQHRLHYNIIVTDSTDATTNTAIPWAAVKENEEVTVKARLIPDKGIAADNIIFKTAEGDALTANRNGDEWTVQLPQLTHEQILSINAIDSETNQTVGKLQAIGYTPIEKRVILVAVNGQSTPSISQVESYLNTHYKQAVASWKVEIGNPLQVDGFDGTLQDSEQATLSTYSAGMKTIIRAFTKDTTTIDKEAFYLFMIDKSSEGNAGYMPRKHRYGFIYMGETQTNVNRTIAHELGHGAFRLQHTWEEYPNIAQGSSQNLMDYSTGTTLRKYQWDLIHNPPLVIGLVEDMGEGALALSDGEIIQLDAYIDDKFGEGVRVLDCYSRANDRARKIYKRYKTYHIEIGLIQPDEISEQAFLMAGYAFVIELITCETEIENCNSEVAQTAFACGAANAILQEFDLILIADLIADAIEADYDALTKKFFECLQTKIKIGDRPSKQELSDLFYECLIGTTPEKITQEIEDFLAEHWTEPYYQGQATVFAVTLITPFKGKIIAKLKKLPKFSGKLPELKKLSKELANAGSDWISFLGKNIDDLATAPTGYSFFTKNGKKWIKQIDASDLNTNRFTVKNGKIVKYADGITHSLYKTADELAVTFDKLGEVSQKIRQQAFDLFKEKNWAKLEKLFDVNNINGKWPPNRGFIDFTTEPLSIGKEIDRFGGKIVNGKFFDDGTFASPLGASFEGRALPSYYLTNPKIIKRKYKVIKEIPNVKKGPAAPWFGQPGKGTQYELPFDIDKLLEDEYIILIN